MKISHLTPGDLRTRTLRTLLRDGQADVYVFRLYCAAYERMQWVWPKGTSAAVIAGACEYQGDAAGFVSAMRQSEWLIAHEDGSIELAGFADEHAREIAGKGNGEKGGRGHKGNGKVTERYGKGNGKVTETQPEGREGPLEGVQPRDGGKVTERYGKGKGKVTETKGGPVAPPPIGPPQTPPLPSPPSEVPPSTTAPVGRFRPPTVEEVDEYCRARGNGIDAKAFADFYRAKGWMIGKSPMKDWMAAVRTWEGRREGTRADESKDYGV